MVLEITHVSTWLYEELVLRLQWGNGLSGQIGAPVTDLIMKSCNYAALLSIQGMVSKELGDSLITVMR